jgi:hypothetical protein
MSSPFILIDTNAVINLFAADGTARWDVSLKDDIRYLITRRVF